MPARPGAIVLATANPHKVEELRAILRGPGDAPRVLALTDLPGHKQLREPEEHGVTFAANARIKALGYASQIVAIPEAMLVLPAGAVVLADDSGIEIDALTLPDATPRPGVISSHYSTDGRETGLTRAQRDAANNARVLRELEGVPPERRGARFVCCMCVASITPARAASVSAPSVGAPAVTPGFGDPHCVGAPAVTPGHPVHVNEHYPSVLLETRGAFEGRIGDPPHMPRGEHGFGYDPLFLVAPEFERTGAELDPETKNRLSHRARAAGGVVEWLHRL